MPLRGSPILEAFFNRTVRLPLYQTDNAEVNNNPIKTNISVMIKYAIIISIQVE